MAVKSQWGWLRRKLMKELELGTGFLESFLQSWIWNLLSPESSLLSLYPSLLSKKSFELKRKNSKHYFFNFNPTDGFFIVFFFILISWRFSTFGRWGGQSQARSDIDCKGKFYCELEKLLFLTSIWLIIPRGDLI